MFDSDVFLVEEKEEIGSYSLKNMSKDILRGYRIGNQQLSAGMTQYAMLAVYKTNSLITIVLLLLLL
jgi:hypothetical protein